MRYEPSQSAIVGIRKNVPSPEMEVGEWRKNNDYCSESALIVKSKRLIMSLMTRPAQLEIVVVW